MKKILLLSFLFISSVSFSQTVQQRLGLFSSGMPGKIYNDTVYTLPRTTLKYWDGYGTWGSFYDTARAAISATGTGISYNSATGVITGTALVAADTVNKWVQNVTKNTAGDSFRIWKNGTYTSLKDSSGAGSSGWLLTGNAGTTAGTNFIGTTDNQNLQFKRNNIFSGIIDTTSTTDGQTAFGFGALKSVTAINGNTAFGYKALTSFTTGGSNTSFNTAIGNMALSALTTGIRNTATGYNSLKTNSTANDNTSLGYNTLLNSTTANNTAIGSGALAGQTTGSGNTAIGYNAIATATDGINNTAIGASTGANLKGFGNVAIGYNSLNGATVTGNTNIAIGYNGTLNANTSGANNNAIGRDALLTNTTGSSNIANGANALYNNQTGSFNVAMGEKAGRYKLGGGEGGNSYGSIFIGDSTRMNAINQIHQIVIGNNVTGNGSYTTVLGDSSTLSTQIYGITATAKGTAVASASAIVPTGNLFHVTGTTTITSITATNVIAGAIITIIFDGALTFTNGSNLKIGSDFVTTADDTITLAFDGTNFYQISRSVN